MDGGARRMPETTGRYRANAAVTVPVADFGDAIMQLRRDGDDGFSESVETLRPDAIGWALGMMYPTCQ
jgi:hypothetical protein